MDKSGDNILMKTHAIFTLPPDQISGTIDKLVIESHPQELLHSLEQIIDIIYGSHSRWDLRSITLRSDGINYRFFEHLLAPDGPVFRMIYKLVSYWDSKTVYNLTESMAWIRDLFEEGMPEYFMDKVSVDDKTRKIMHMSLNAFEYYMLHYAYYVVNPWVKNQSEYSRIHDSIYMRLLECYLVVFVPCDAYEVLPYVPVSYTSLRSSLPRNNQASYTPDPKPCIFRQSLFRNTTDSIQQPYKHNVLVWRSEAVIYILSYVWLNYGKQDPTTGIIVREAPPSVDLVRVLRSMMKHFHFFANSAVGDMSAMDSLKRIVRPLCADKIYRFFHRAVYNWPLDISFRVILEAWLSYIQPWRYTDYSNFGLSANNNSLPDASRDRQVERVWQTFISENLFTYTIIYQQVLPRFYQMDLTTLMNSMIIQRVLKVFSQQNLNILIAEVEACVVDETKWDNEVILQKSNIPTLPALTMDGTPIAKIVEHSSMALAMGKHWHNNLCQKLLHLEGVRYTYMPMFQQNTDEAYKLLDVVMAAYISSYAAMTTIEHEVSFGQESFFSSVKNLFIGSKDELYSTSVADRMKVVTFLQQTLTHIAHLYNVPNPALPDPKSFHPLPSSPHSPCQVPTVTKLSPQRWQVSLHKDALRRPTPTFQGDPDLMPIMSHECAFCVRIFYKLTTKINNKYSAEIDRIFNKPNLTGGIVRQLLLPPKRIRFYDKNCSNLAQPTLTEKMLPPRLSLRWMASYRFLTFIAVLLILSNILYDCWLFLPFIVCGLWFIYLGCRAILEPFWPIVSPETNESSSETRELFDLDVSL